MGRTTHPIAKKIKILFFYPNEFLGPEMTVYEQIIRHLDGDRFIPYLVLNGDAEGDSRLADANGVVSRRFKLGQSFRAGTGKAIRSGLGLPAALISLCVWARREGIDIVHCAATPRASTLGLLVARLAGARLLLHYHVLPGRYGGPRGLFERSMARRANCSVAVSSFLADRVRQLGIPAAQVRVVVNGVDCGRFNPDVDGSAMRREYGIAPGEPLVVQMARLIRQKRQEDVVRAFALARRDVPQLRCLLVGWEDPRYEGPFAGYKAELEQLAAAEGLGDSLIIAEPRPEAPQLVAAADIVVMPAIGDAWNLAVTEGMAGGKPVVGSDSGGIPEQIIDGVTGYLIPPHDVEALAERLVTLARDPQLRATMGTAAHKHALSSFDERHVAEGFAPIYEQLAAPGQSLSTFRTADAHQ